jgi:hypothetical protein
MRNKRLKRSSAEFNGRDIGSRLRGRDWTSSKQSSTDSLSELS